MPDFLLELLSEEIPARMQAKAAADLARLFAERIGAAGLQAESVETFATPRRLALIARGLPEATPAVSEEIKGPRASAPPQALEGFLRKTGLEREQLVERDGVLFAIIGRPGRAAAEVLAEAVPAIIRGFPWPKSMRWGAASVSTESLRWVRPLHGIVALLGERIVEFEIAGVKSGAATVGHLFHHPGPITIGSASDYAEKLRACRVILDPAERRAIIAQGAARLAAQAGLALVEDEGLLAENAGLTEWPVPLLGSFDPDFLDVPAEVIRLTMRTHQKYFTLRIPPRNGGEERRMSGGHPSTAGRSLGDRPAKPDGGGAGEAGSIAPNFVCVANIEASDGGAAIAEGNRKVLAARFADARYFWEHDLKVPLKEQARKLSQIVFHEKLGTLADKVERVAKLARWLVEHDVIPAKAGISLPSSGAGKGSEIPASAGMTKGELANLAERAARLCKADLVTGLVGEFPELQGIVGGHLARAQGGPDAIADAIRDHYKPGGQGDDLPTAPVTVAVSLADKLDSLAAFFAHDMAPTGSKDPFALRRAALGVIALVVEAGLRLSLSKVFRAARELSGGSSEAVAARHDLLHFLADRLKVQQREAGVRHDLIDAVFALGGEDDLVRLLARVKALQAFVETAEGADLLAGYKRAANILKKEGWPPSVTPAEAGARTDEGRDSGLRRNDGGSGGSPLPYEPLPEEAALIAALDAAEPRAAAAVEAEDFEGAMAALAGLRGPVDAFFDKVTVNDADRVKRAARLDLLMRMRDAVHQVADFSRIEG